MREAVHHHVIGRADQALDGPVTGCPTRGIKNRVIQVEELGDCLFQA